tara:strand:+ start:170 stop:382 length:213 start_codon:yes stop_codon:yes gene_type:complete
MGIFKPKTPPRDIELEKQMEARRLEEEAAKKAKTEKDKEKKWRREQGMVGTRSLFSKAGGGGFFYEGDET